MMVQSGVFMSNLSETMAPYEGIFLAKLMKKLVLNLTREENSLHIYIAW